LIIFQASNFRDQALIAQTWNNFVQQTQLEAAQDPSAAAVDVVQEKVRSLGRRVGPSGDVFNPRKSQTTVYWLYLIAVEIVLPILLNYNFEPSDSAIPGDTRGPREWPAELFFELGVPFEAVFNVLENIFFTNDMNWSAGRRRIIAALIVHVAERWLNESASPSGGNEPFGGAEVAAAVLDGLTQIRETQILGPLRLDGDRLLALIDRVRRYV
jgi:hypothetical protein